MCVNYSTNPITIDCGHCLKALCLPELAGYLSSCSLLWMQGKDVAERLYNKYPYQELVFLSWKGSLGQTLSSEHYRWGLPKETEQIFCEDDRGLLCVHCWLRSRRLTEAAQQTRLLGTPGKGLPLKTHFCKACMKFLWVCFLGDWITLFRCPFQNLCPGLR